MKIIVKSDAFRFFVPIPTAVFLSRPMVRIWLRMMRQSQQYVTLPEQAVKAIWNLPEESVLRLCDELQRVKRKHKSWDLVEVETSSGQQVLIQL